jgi:LysW-gamma-L-lysine carboxypeptidase
VEYLVGQMRALGFSEASIDEAGNAVGLMGSGPRQVVLLGHIDTVPGEIPVRVADAEVGATHASPLLYGRGAVDAKGSLACFVDAVAQVGAVDGWQVAVIGAVEEERDSDGARFVVPRFRPEYAVIGEPNRWDRVALGYKGSAWANLTVRREQTHTAAAYESACEAALAAWLSIQAWTAEFNLGRERAFDRLMLTLRQMSSGDEDYQQWASLSIGARLPLDLDPPAWYERLAALAAEAKVEPSGFALPAYQCEKNTPLVRAFLAAIRGAGGTPSFVYKTGTADLNVVGPAWNCPALVYGPGDSTLDHTPHESLPLEEYARAVAALTTALRTLLR